MSIFEWLFERNSPGPVGNIRRFKDRDNWPNGLIIFCGILAIIALATFVWYAMLADAFQYDVYHHVVKSALLVLYLFVAATYSVYPATNNMGFRGFGKQPFPLHRQYKPFSAFLFNVSASGETGHDTHTTTKKADFQALSGKKNVSRLIINS